jgi:phage shock protein E
MARHRSVCLFAALVSALLLGAIDCRYVTESGCPVRITAAELEERMRNVDAPLILDVRSFREYAAGHVPKAVNIPHIQLRGRLGELGIDKSDELVVYCLGGQRADLARQVLVAAGYTCVRHLEGEMRAWQRGGYPIE